MLAVCAAVVAVTNANADVKVGFSAPLSGPVASVGQDQYDGFMLGVELLQGKFGGQPVTVLKEDDQLKPELGNQIARKFIDRDKVDALVGLGFSNVLMASLPRIVESVTVAIATNAGPSPIAGAGCISNVFSMAWQNDGSAEAMGKFAQDAGYKKVFLLAPNYQAGKDAVAGFKRQYNGAVAGEVYTTVNQPDYSAEIAQLQAANPDAVYVFYPGGMGVNFIKQFRQAGLLGKIPLMSVSTADGSTLPALKETALGVISGTFWGPDFDNETSKNFVAAFEKKYGRIPSQYAAQSYDSALLIDSALKKTGGNVTDKKAFADALRAAEYKSLRGNLKFNKNGFPIQDMYVFEVAKDSQGRVSLKTLSKALANHPDSFVGQCPL